MEWMVQSMWQSLFFLNKYFFFQCSVSCGINGLQKRSRTCQNTSNTSDCGIGVSEENRSCDKIIPCPINGNWGNWNNWGDGIKQRKMNNLNFQIFAQWNRILLLLFVFFYIALRHVIKPDFDFVIIRHHNLVVDLVLVYLMMSKIVLIRNIHIAVCQTNFKFSNPWKNFCYFWYK